MVEFTIITRDNNGGHCFRADQVSVQLEGVNNTIVVPDNNDVANFVPHQVGEMNIYVSVCQWRWDKKNPI